MTLIKSLLLGSAAGIVAVATAQAADLPTRKAAPVEYVRVCNVGGITGWTLPGSDTCVKFSGYMTAHFIGGNISNQYNSASIGGSRTRLAARWRSAAHLSQSLMVQGGDSQTLQRLRVSDPFRPATSSMARVSRSRWTASLRSLPGTAIAGRCRCPTRRIRSSTAMRSAGTSAPTSALISRRTPPTAR